MKAIPACILPLSFQKSVSVIPIKIANTGPPTTGAACPSSHAGTAMARHSSSPRPFF